MKNILIVHWNIMKWICNIGKRSRKNIKQLHLYWSIELTILSILNNVKSTEIRNLYVFKYLWLHNFFFLSDLFKYCQYHPASNGVIEIYSWIVYLFKKLRSLFGRKSSVTFECSPRGEKWRSEEYEWLLNYQMIKESFTQFGNEFCTV